METEFLSTIQDVRKLIGQNCCSECEAVIATAMFEHPHAAVPHNLMGLLYEHEGLHLQAMRHFRAAYALDPTYLPASRNMNCYGILYRKGRPAYCEADCQVPVESAQSKEEPLCIL